jgi:hypothetical protein
MPNYCYLFLLFQNFTEAYDLHIDPHQLNNLASSLSPAIENKYMSWLEHLKFCSGVSCHLHHGSNAQNSPQWLWNGFHYCTSVHRIIYHNIVAVIEVCSINNVLHCNCHISAMSSLLITDFEFQYDCLQAFFFKQSHISDMWYRGFCMMF